MKKNIVKGAKTTTDNTKYICVSQYGKNANEIGAFSIIVLDSKIDQSIDVEILFAEDYLSQSDFIAGLGEAIIKYLTIHDCKAIKDFRIHPIEYDEKGLFLWTALNAKYYEKVLEEEALREIEKRNLSKSMKVQINNQTIPNNIVDVKAYKQAYKEAILNSMLDKKYPLAKSIIV